jgi:hypothetical protein
MEIITVYTENRMKPFKYFLGTVMSFWKLRVGGMYSNQVVLNASKLVIWHRIRISGGFLWKWYRILGFHKNRRRVSWPAERLLASEEELFSLESEINKIADRSNRISLSLWLKPEFEDRYAPFPYYKIAWKNSKCWVLEWNWYYVCKVAPLYDT